MTERERYGFDALPLSPIRRGTNVLVAGPAHDGARELALAMLSSGADEGTIVVATNESAPRLVEDFEALGARFDPDHAAIVDCVGNDVQESFPARVLTVSSPRDLTGIGMRYAALHSELLSEGVTRVRSGLVSLTTLLSLDEFRKVSQFVHTLAGRVRSVDGLGVFLVDPTTQDERAVNTMSQFCDGRIDVRYEGDAPELRARGLREQPRSWTAFDVE